MLTERQQLWRTHQPSRLYTQRYKGIINRRIILQIHLVRVKYYFKFTSNLELKQKASTNLHSFSSKVCCSSEIEERQLFEFLVAPSLRAERLIWSLWRVSVCISQRDPPTPKKIIGSQKFQNPKPECVSAHSEQLFLCVYHPSPPPPLQ